MADLTKDVGFTIERVSGKKTNMCILSCFFHKSSLPSSKRVRKFTRAQGSGWGHSAGLSRFSEPLRTQGSLLMNSQRLSRNAHPSPWQLVHLRLWLLCEAMGMSAAQENFMPKISRRLTLRLCHLEPRDQPSP